jgi:lysophospholipase L1-like esterase
MTPRKKAAPPPAPRGRRPLKALGFVAYNIVAATLLFEIVIASLLHAPRVVGASPEPMRRSIQQVYRHFNRSLIQFDPQCARYDAGLAYTLKPGRCTFGNIEFENVYRISEPGVRDDPASLDAPEVIVLGDSHAMGWGVDQEQALPQVLARKLGRKVLNAAVSSYGTAREMLMLKRLNTSKLRVLVVQYSDNDLPENRTFRLESNQLPIMSEQQYQTIVSHYGSQRTYYPGKYVYRLLMKILRLEEPEPDQVAMESARPEQEAQLFLWAVEHASGVRLDDVQIVVFEINEQTATARPFIAAVDKERLRRGRAPFINRVIAVDVAPHLTRDDFYRLDDHMNASGHEKVAAMLADRIRANVR